MIKKVQINLVTWNGEKYLPNLFASLKNQTFQDFNVIIIDNNSTDETLKLLNQCPNLLKIIHNNENKGFAKAFNQAIRLSLAEYILIINQDIILTHNFLQGQVSAFEQLPQTAALGSKVYRVYQDHYDNVIKTNFFDTTGIVSFKNKKFVDRGSGEEDVGQYNKRETVFGISGAVAMYRRNDLEKIKLPIGENLYEYFDEDYFMYKEDVDLSWRLNNIKRYSIYEPGVKCYHYRTVKNNADSDIFTFLEARNSWNYLNKQRSYRNHLLTLVKNLSWPEINFSLVWFEIRKIVYLLLFEQRTLLALKDFFILLPKAYKKRRIINRQKKQDGLINHNTNL